MWETEGTGHQFALRHGFEEMRRTYTTHLGLDGVDAAGVFRHWPHGLESQGYDLSRYPDTPARIRPQMVAVLQEVYTNTHLANPVRPASRDEWRALAFSEDLLPWGSVAVLHKKRCVAAALLHESAEDGHVDLGWRGVPGSSQRHSRALILLMTAHHILAAATRGYRTYHWSVIRRICRAGMSGKAVPSSQRPLGSRCGVDKPLDQSRRHPIG